MRLAFAAFGQTEIKGTAESLARHQMRLADKKLTALIEVRFDPSQRALLLYAHGAQIGAYINDGTTCQPLLPSTELFAGRETGSGTIRVITLPDMVGRLAWLVCESTGRSSAQGANLASWNQQLNAWNIERVNGLVEIASSTAHGFLQLSGGEVVPEETAILHDNGTSLPGFTPANPETKWEATLFEVQPAGNASQCQALRRAARHWSRAVFESYQNIAGERFLLMLVHELQAQVSPWKWNIRVEQNGLMDEHFFPGAEATAHAYRALLMGMGAQMSFAIGGYLTQRILVEMYGELKNEERAQLEAYHLIPTAFSE